MKSSLLCVLFIAATSSSLLTADLKTVDDFRAVAAKANAVLTIPDWEQTPEAVEASMKDAIAKANAALDQIGAQDLGKVTFKSTVVALDDATYQAGLAANKATKLSPRPIRNSRAKTRSCSGKHCAIIAAPAWSYRPISGRKSNTCARNCPNSALISTPTS